MMSGLPPRRTLPVIRVFLSSTFGDLKQERNAFEENVWKPLHRYCQQRRFTFQAIDLRWGVPVEAGLDHQTMQICFDEIERAQRISPKPNFVILLGNRYGWRPLPEVISREEFDALIETARQWRQKVKVGEAGWKSAEQVLREWYRLDGNAVSPIALLRSRNDSPDGRRYAYRVDAAGNHILDSQGRPHDTQEWIDAHSVIRQVIDRAFPPNDLAARFTSMPASSRDDPSNEVPATVRFQASATEQEIWRGAFQAPQAHRHVVACFRELQLTDRDRESEKQLAQHLELDGNRVSREIADNALNALKRRLADWLGHDRIIKCQCAFEVDSNGGPTGEIATDHIPTLCKELFDRLRQIVAEQINEYWGCDLSAPNADISQTQVAERELDLELRRHQQFARECSSSLVGRDAEVAHIRQRFLGASNDPYVLTGPSGSGKSALMAFISQHPIDQDQRNSGIKPVVISRFIGVSPQTATLRSLLTSLCRELRRYFPTTTQAASRIGDSKASTNPIPDDLSELIEEFYAHLARATADRPIYVLIDAIDHLDEAENARQTHWIRSPILWQAVESRPCHARLVVSCLSPSADFPLDDPACEPFRYFQRRGLDLSNELGELSLSDAKELLMTKMESAGRRLAQHQQEAVAAAIETSTARRNPLYLTALFEQVRNWNDFSASESAPSAPGALPEIPDNLADALQSFLKSLCDEGRHGQLARTALGYLLASRHGLSDEEILQILYADKDYRETLTAAESLTGQSIPPDADRIPVALWVRLRSDLAPFVADRAAPGATVNQFYHRQLEREAKTTLHREEFRNRLCKYFQGQQRWSDRKIYELPWQLSVSKQWSALRDALTEEECFRRTFQLNKYDLFHYWRELDPHYDLSASYSYAFHMWSTDRPGTSELADLATELASFFSETDHLYEAIEMQRTALALDERALGMHHPRIARDLNNLAQHLRASAEFGEAESLLRRALKIEENRFDGPTRTIAVAMNSLSQVLQDVGRLDEAESLQRHALEVDRRIYGAVHPNVATRLNNLAVILRDSKRLQQAEELMRQALTIDEMCLGLSHPEVATDLANLGTMLIFAGRPSEAEPILRRASTIIEEYFGNDNSNLAICLGHLGWALCQLNQLQEAEPVARRSLSISERIHGPDHPSVASALNQLGYILSATGRKKDAESAICLAIGIYAAALGVDHPTTQELCGNYEFLLRELGYDEEEIHRRIKKCVNRSSPLNQRP